MELTIVGALLAVVIIGSATVSWGVRRFNLPTGVLAFAFALTAISWLALLVTAIGLTVRTITIALARI